MHSFDGFCDDPRDVLPNEAASEDFLEVYSQFEWPAGLREALLTRAGAVADAELARGFDWNIGRLARLTAGNDEARLLALPGAAS